MTGCVRVQWLHVHAQGGWTRAAPHPQLLQLKTRTCARTQHSCVTATHINTHTGVPAPAGCARLRRSGSRHDTCVVHGHVGQRHELWCGRGEGEGGGGQCGERRIKELAGRDMARASMGSVRPRPCACACSACSPLCTHRTKLLMHRGCRAVSSAGKLRTCTHRQRQLRQCDQAPAELRVWQV
jgi:hypothetical protein